MASTSGIRETEDMNTQRRFDVASKIALLDQSKYPLFALLTSAKGKDPVSGKSKRMKKKATTDPDFRWYEDDFQSRKADIESDQGSTDPDSGSVSIDVGSDEIGYFQAGDVVVIPSEDWKFEVTGISTNSIDCSDELGGAGTAVDISDAAIWIIGNANEEGAGLRDIKDTSLAEKINYTQIFRTPVGITNTAKNTDTYTRKNDLAYQRKKKAKEHAIDIERAFLFGEKSEDTSGSKTKRFTDGVFSRLSTFAHSSVDTEAEFETFLEDGFKHGNTEKYLFASPAVLSLINGFAKDKLQVVDPSNTYGVRIWKYLSAHGTVNVIKHPLLQGTPYGKYGVLLDMETLTYRYLQNRDTKLLTNRQANDEDSRIDEYLTECGLQLEQEERSAEMSTGSL